MVMLQVYLVLSYQMPMQMKYQLPTLKVVAEMAEEAARQLLPAAKQAAVRRSATMGAGQWQAELEELTEQLIAQVEQLLEAFEDEAAEFASCGCALVAVRRVEGTGSDSRKAAAYAERFREQDLAEEEAQQVIAMLAALLHDEIILS